VSEQTPPQTAPHSACAGTSGDTSRANVPNAASVAEKRVGGVARRLADTTRQFIDLCRRERLWAAAMAAFVLVWTVELYLVQAHTLVYPNETGPRFAFFAPKIRLVLDLLFVSALTCWLRPRWLCVAVIGAFFAYLGLITYYQHFARPISLLTIFANWREGSRVIGLGVELFPKSVAVILLVVLAVELGALALARKVPLPRNCARLGGAAFTAAYVVLYLATNVYDPLETIQTTRGVGRLGAIRGYLGPWFAEWYYLQDDRVLARALELRDEPYDRLTPLEADLPLHKHLVILQAESLDTNILGYRVGGQEVTPFLNKLRAMSMYFRVRSFHVNGSADADFNALTGTRGSDHENTYVIPGYPYENTTPQLLARAGFACYSFHGANGEFYNRRAPFEKMGFAGIYFQEELVSQFGLKVGGWGISDKDLLTAAALEMRQATEPTCHFIITLTTHFPYTLLSPADEEIFKPANSMQERYINNMRYLDNCLRDYITALGAGTTIMIYADHPTENESLEACDRQGGRQYIPCMIYDSDQDLSQLQRTRDNPAATDGSLTLVDVVNYLRGQIARHNAPVAEVAH
jgi:hypothetical protein